MGIPKRYHREANIMMGRRKEQIMTTSYNRKPTSIPAKKCKQSAFNALYPLAAYGLPEAAYLELTPACNNRCPGCVNDGFIANFDTRDLKPGFHRRPLNGDEWQSILDKLGRSVTFIHLTGGEPTLHPDFLQIANTIDQRGIDFVVFTNGRWRDPRRLLTDIADLPHFSGFLISLHGASAKTHESFSGVSGSFGETLANAKLAACAGLPVTISTVITCQNIAELGAVVALARELGACGVAFNRYIIPAVRERQLAQGGLMKQMAPTPFQLRKAAQNIEEMRRLDNDAFSIDYGPCIPQCFVASSSKGCSAGETFFVVDPWGNVKPCPDVSIYCGGLLVQSIEDVWQNAAMEAWRNMVPTGCSSCSALSACRSGCRAAALGSGLGYDPLMTQPVADSFLSHSFEPILLTPALSSK
jgi:radical SAM protein with 4Fe4S-binding SPASM domain